MGCNLISLKIINLQCLTVRLGHCQYTTFSQLQEFFFQGVRQPSKVHKPMNKCICLLQGKKHGQNIIKILKPGVKLYLVYSLLLTILSLSHTHYAPVHCYARWCLHNACQSAQRDISPEHIGMLFSTTSPDFCRKLWTIYTGYSKASWMLPRSYCG